MIPPSFAYHAPSSVDAALALLGQYGEEAKILAGGHSLLPMLKLRFAEPAHLVDLNGIAELQGIQDEGDTLLIGAMTCENDLIDSALLRQKCPLLPEAAAQIADPQVRNRGTIGGDIAHGDPANDHPAIALALDAQFLIAGPDGERIEPAHSFFIDTFEIRMAPHEILKAIRVPVAPPGSGHAYCKLKRKIGDWATAAAAVQLRLEGERCAEVRIGLTNVGPTALRAEAAEQLLTGQVIGEALIQQAAQQAMAICEPAEDLRGSPEYKTAMAGEMTRRALRLALQRARG